uniref:Proline rich 5 like n=1 Tax=Cynoglossus semilaevis TaxID=244447 RepID=A0A3P8X2S1_CYNSE
QALYFTECMMGSFRRPRPRFMSSPVLSDLARFHASSPALQISNTRVWNRYEDRNVVSVIKVFKGGTLQNNELYTLNDSIRWLLKTEMGSFITDYFQNQLLTRGLSEVLDQILLHSGETLLVLADMWDRFFTETLPTLQAIFYPVQGQELSVRQLALLAFRDLVLLKLHLEASLQNAASVPPAVTHMLLVLQGVHESSSPSLEYYQLERLVSIVVSPYIKSRDLRTSGLFLGAQPEIRVTHHLCSSDSSSLSPVVEQEGEAYLEKVGGVRRHTVANAHTDVRLLSLSSRMNAEMDKGQAPPPTQHRPTEDQPAAGSEPDGFSPCIPAGGAAPETPGSPGEDRDVPLQL